MTSLFKNMCQTAGKIHLAYAAMPIYLPFPDTSCVIVVPELTCDQAGLAASVYAGVVGECVSEVKNQTLTCLESLVKELTPESGDATRYTAWSAQLGTVSLAISISLCKADPTTRLFATEYEHWLVNLGTTANGFSQVEVRGFRTGAALGASAKLMATILVVIPQEAGKRPCRRVVACLERAQALASHVGTWVFVVVIDVGKHKNKSLTRSFGTPPPS